MLTVADRGEGGGIKFAKILLTSYVNAPLDLILLVVGEYLKSLLLQPTRGLDVLFHISRILVQDSNHSWLLLHPLKPLRNAKCLVKNGVSHK